MVRVSLTTAFVSTLLATAFASPVERDSFVATIPLKRVAPASRTSKDVVAHGASRLAKVNKFASSGTVTNAVDSYLAPVTVGGQSFDLIVDTGSSNTWVGANSQYDGSGTDTGDSVSVSYGSGSFSGDEYTASVSFGGLTVSKQSVGVADQAQGFDGVDGIFGVGPVDLTEGTVDGLNTVPTFLDNLKRQGSISTEVLGVYFKPESGSDSDDNNGELTLGGTDSSKYTGSITYTPTLTSGDAAAYWGIAVSSLTYGSTTLGSRLTGIVDTGTTLIYIPTSAYTKFLSAAGGSTDQNTGLAKFSRQPTGTITFTVGGKGLTLSPSQYLVPQAQYSNFGISGSGYYSWINDGGSSGVDMIIGQKFLENYYSVFDTTNARVGFATRT